MDKDVSAPAHLPFYITPPGQTDILLNITIVVVLAIIVMIGTFYLQLHAFPERMAHRTNKVQFEIVAVLALLALFTHNHIFWVAGLLLAMVQIPDFSGVLGSISRSLEQIAASRAPLVAPTEPPPDGPDFSHSGERRGRQ